MRILFLIFFYGFANWLPDSYMPLVGKISNYIRIFCVKRIFKECGNISTINRKIYFGSGKDVCIGDYSGIGSGSIIPNNIVIGKYVMMAPEVYIISSNHGFSDLSKPMCFQNSTVSKKTVIEDDCWIGARVIMTPGRHVKKGSVIAAGAVLTKDFDKYSIVGGNPAKLIRYR